MTYKDIGFTEDMFPAVTSFKAQTKAQADLVEVVKDLCRSKFNILTILGMQGRGKTFAVANAVGSYAQYLEDCGINPIEKILYTSHYELDLLNKSCMNPSAKKTQYDVFRDLIEIDILVIDEFLKGTKTAYAVDYVENIINKRYAKEKRTVIITNHSPQELKQLLDPTIIDRMSNGKKGRMFILKGDSLR